MSQPQPPPPGAPPAGDPPADDEEETYIGGEDQVDGDDEAFIDLDDPENEVRDIPDSAAPDAADEPPAEDEEEKGEFPEDKEPVRDDSVFSWSPEDNKPLHAVATHPSRPTVIAVGGEAELVSVVDIGQRTEGVSPVTSVCAGHKDTVTQLAFSPDGALLASGSMDCTVKLWDTNSYACLHTLEDLAGEVEFLLWHPSSKVLLGGGSDAQCLLWNVAKGAVAQYFVGHRGPVTCGAWAMDLKKVLTGSNDGTLMMFNPKTGLCETTISKELSTVKAGITCLTAANAAADLFVAGCEDGSLHVVSLEKGKVVKSVDDIHDQAVESVVFADLSSGIGLFASCSCDCKVVVWSASDFGVRSVTRCGEGVTRMLWRNELLLAACTDGDTRIWDGRVAAGEPRTVLMGHRRLVLGIAMACDGGHVVTCADDGTVKAFVDARYKLDEPEVSRTAVKQATTEAQAMSAPAAAAAAADDVDA